MDDQACKWLSSSYTKQLATFPNGQCNLVNNFSNNISNICSSFGYYQNCRGLRTKLISINCNIASFNFIFFVLTENWLTDEFSNCDLGMLNYNVYRCDRSSLTSIHSRGGGVLIGVRKDIPSQLVPILDNSIEYLFVSFLLNKRKYLVSGAYFPPNSNISSYDKFTNTLENLVSDRSLVYFLW